MSECMGFYKVCENPCTLVQVHIQNAYEVKYTPSLLSYHNKPAGYKDFSTHVL